MREEQVFPEPPVRAADFHVGGNTGKLREAREKLRLEAQGDQRGLWRDDLEAELGGDLVGERRRADLRYREPAGRDDKGGRFDALARRLELERAPAPLPITDPARVPPLDLSHRTLDAQHLDDP